ncbi:hypothetical protein [Desulfosporosinus sp. OT]|uniref:hypothetical protein n=1 Tax=Desulfosporosinus sp. OT TaxID=913865 RepID=UPI00058DDCAD|nr:hypothetical protein [Desulfosporosinus sp. OT]
MVLKQASTAQCVCGQAVEFPEAQVKTMCRCGAIWELGHAGYWSITSFVLFLAKSRLKPDEYKRYPRSRKRRKAGRRC